VRETCMADVAEAVVWKCAPESRASTLGRDFLVKWLPEHHPELLGASDGEP